MKAFGSWLVQCLLYAFALLPLPVLYIFSYCIYLVLKYILWYRDSVISHNLVQAFPEKSPEELSRIQDRVWRNLADLLVENIKTLTASRAWIQKHIAFADLGLFNRLYAEKKNFIVVMGHLGNWEWSGLSMSIEGSHTLKAIYRPLKNPSFNRFFLRFRSRFGARLVPMSKVGRVFLEPAEKPFCFTFIADQTPPAKGAYWMRFLHRETPFFDGYDILARKFNLPVVFVWIERKKRGHYLIHTELLEENPAALAEGVLVHRFARLLEAKIQLDPSGWLWSHRRWKHIRPVSEPLHEEAD